MSEESMKDKAIELARTKAVREQKKIWVYYDSDSEDDYYVSPREIDDKPHFSLVDTFETDSMSDEEVESRIVEITDHNDLSEGSQVLIDGEDPQQIIRVTDRQITTHRGNKFRRSDGSEWGTDGGKQLTHKVIS